MRKKNILKALYFGSFLFTLHVALVSYVNSSFLEGIVGGKVSLVYAIASAFGIFMLFKIPSIDRKIGNYRTMLFLLLINLISLFVLSSFRSGWFLAVMFIVYMGTLSPIIYAIDVFIERYTHLEDTGKIRGLYFAVCSSCQDLD